MILILRLRFCVSFNLTGKEEKHHLTTEARRRGGQNTRTVIAEKDVPVRVIDLRFIMVKLVKRLVDRYLALFSFIPCACYIRNISCRSNILVTA
jgi:hypothetical protein